MCQAGARSGSSRDTIVPPPPAKRGTAGLGARRFRAFRTSRRQRESASRCDEQASQRRCLRRRNRSRSPSRAKHSRSRSPSQAKHSLVVSRSRRRSLRASRNRPHAGPQRRRPAPSGQPADVRRRRSKAPSGAKLRFAAAPGYARADRRGARFSFRLVAASRCLDLTRLRGHLSAWPVWAGQEGCPHATNAFRLSAGVPA